MAKKIFTYKGLTVEQLQKLTIEEFAKILPSRMRRHLKRGFTPEEKTLLRKIEKKKSKKDGAFRTHVRNMIILPQFIGLKFAIHKGNEWIPIEINEEMIGHRLGEFAKTRKQVKHSGPGIGATKGTKFSSVK